LDVVGLVLDKTPLYAEQGGQTFDTAEITTKSAEFQCDNTQTYAGYVLHIGTMQKGQIKVGDSVNVKVDYGRRALVAKNHTATHILNYALRQVLGGKIDQKGSLVDETKLRFDFSHNQPIEPEQLKKIEVICNQQIQMAMAINYRDCNLGAAKAINGLRAVFGEQYPDPVRVVSVGPKIDDLLSDKVTQWGEKHSVEFCGGTHVANTSEIYKFVIQIEEGIAKGVRRIVAVTGPQAAVQATLKSKALSCDVDECKTLSGALLDKKIAELRFKIDNDKELSLVLKRNMCTDLDTVKGGQLKAGKAQTKEFEAKAKEIGERLGEEAKKSAGFAFVGVVDAGAGFDDAKSCGAAIEAALKKCDDKAMMFFSNANGKCALLAVVPKALQGKVTAKDWSNKALDAIGAKGGGKEDRAQGQGPDPAGLDAAVAAAKAFVGEAKSPKGSPKASPKGAPKKEGKKKKGGQDAPAADAPKEDDPEKARKDKLKKVTKEGGKRGIEIEGAADMGGLQFFCASVEFPDGDLEMLEESMKAMNLKCAPDEEERRGSSGHIGKMIFSAGTEQLALCAYVPAEKQGELSCEEWLKKVLGSFNGKMVKTSKDVCTGFVKADGDKNIFPLKIREPMLLEANNFLRSKGLFPDNDDDSDEMVFGDDDFPSM